MSKSQPGGSDCDFLVCSPRELGKRLSIPPYPLLLGHSVSGSSAATSPALLTLGYHRHSAHTFKHAILPF
jgi:hypothetical protein